MTAGRKLSGEFSQLDHGLLGQDALREEAGSLQV